MRRQWTKKALSLLLALAMVLGMAPMAYAEGTANVAEVNGVQYGTMTEAISNAGAGQTIRLLTNIELTGAVSLPAGVTLDLNGNAITAGSYKITMAAGAKVVTAKDDASLNRVLTGSNNYLVAYTENEISRTYMVSDVFAADSSGMEVFMAGHATTITSQDGTDTDTNLFLAYTEEESDYVVLYNNAGAARIFGGWKYPAKNYDVDTSEQIVTMTIKSGKVDSLRAGSKEGKNDKSSLTMKSATINVEGGNVGIVASGWYYCQSMETFNVNVSGGTVKTIYGNGETASSSATEIKQSSYVPTVDTANINISGGTVGYVYGSGRAVTTANTSANYSMRTKKANITITGGSVTCVNGGGFNGPEANWGEDSGQDVVAVNEAVITVSGGNVANVFAGGYNGQWKFTHKIDADGNLVFSNYNGTTTKNVRNTVTHAVVNVLEGANITNLYMGGRSYAYVQNSVANITGGTIGTMSTSGNYGYVENSDANVSGGAISKLELLTRNYVGNIDLDVTGGAVTDFYAGMGGAYKNANSVEKDYNISTVAILGNVDVNFADGTVTNSYLTTGLERASSVTSNVPLTVKTINLVEDSGYTGTITSSGNFVIENDSAAWNTIINLATVNESFKPGTAATGIVYTSGDATKAVVADENGVRKLGDAEGYVAEVNGTQYETLANAINAAKSGDTVKLLKDVELTNYLYIDQSITLDLGGHTIKHSSHSAGYMVWVGESCEVTIINGTVQDYMDSVEDGCYYGIILVDNNAKLTLTNLRVLGGTTAIVCYGSNNITLNSSEISSCRDGILSYENSTITLNNSDINASRIGIWTYNNDITILNGSSDINAKHGIVSYDGNITINDNSTITASSDAIQMHGTTQVTMNGGALNATCGIDMYKGTTVAAINNGMITAKTAILAKENASVTIKGGKLIASNVGVYMEGSEGNHPTAAMTGGEIEVTSFIGTGFQLNGNCTYYADENSRKAYPVTVNISGGSIYNTAADQDVERSYDAAVGVFGKGAEVIISGDASLSAHTYAVTGNGSREVGGDDNSGTKITILGGTLKSDLAAIYHPQYGELTVTGGKIEGGLGVQLCSGEGMIATFGGTVEITGTGADDRANKTGDGLIPDGAAVSVVNRDYPGGTPKMTISGGTFKSVQSKALMAYTWSSNTASDWAEANEFLSVTGGTFSSDPTTYVADGYIAKKNSDTAFGVMAKANLTDGVYMSSTEGATAPYYYSSNNGDGTWTVYYVPPYVPPTNTNTETTTNPDGSTTTTTTDKTTGTVTETTTSKVTDPAAGTTTETKVETVTDATGAVISTETVKTTDSTGTTGTTTTTTNSAGQTTVTAEATVTTAAVAEAARNEAPVTLPVEVAATSTTATAPVVEIQVPATTTEVKVEVPVENLTAGTVAVLVKDDGTEEIIKNTTMGENGVVVPLDGSATVKIVDNSKEFEDIHPVDHWSEESVDFVSSREIFNGTSDTTFDPEVDMTRGMMVTVLARYDGADTTGGETWYSKGVEWAVNKEISDGANPTGKLTREEMAVMLYRYVGSPDADGELAFPDAGEVSEYAVEAMRWAVANGLINGMDGKLNPKGFATRAQLAAILMRFCQNVAN